MGKTDVFAFAYREFHQLGFRCARSGGKLKKAHSCRQDSHPFRAPSSFSSSPTTFNHQPIKTSYETPAASAAAGSPASSPVPNVLLAAVLACVFGGPNCTRLNRLNASTRNVRFTRSPIRVVFATARFQLWTPCARRSGSVLVALPSFHRSDGSVEASPATKPALGTLKQSVLNHRFRRSRAEPDTFLSQFGSTFGRNS